MYENLEWGTSIAVTGTPDEFMIALLKQERRDEARERAVDDYMLRVFNLPIRPFGIE
jgi:hypothetical protein